MNKKDLIDAIASKRPQSQKKEIEAVVDLFLEEIIASLGEHEEVKLSGFGNFEIRSRKERIGVDPNTQEKISIPATSTVGFKPSKILKEAVKGE